MKNGRRYELSAASKRMNLNNPILSGQEERSVGETKPILLSVLKGRNNEVIWQISVIFYITRIKLVRGFF